MSTRAEIIEATLARAHAEIGTRETTSNWGPKVASFLRETGITFPAPWCAAFTFAIIDRTCRALHVANPVIKTAYCPTVEHWADEHEILHQVERGGRPERGDLFLYRSGGRAKHIGFVSGFRPGGHTFASIEGNTNLGGSPEGIGVFARTRPVDNRYRFVRWASLIPTVGTGTTVAVHVSGQHWFDAPLIDGRALAPVRAWGERMGFRVDWNADEQAILYDGAEVPAEVTLIGETAHAPVRDLARFSGLSVVFDQSKRVVRVSKA